MKKSKAALVLIWRAVEVQQEGSTSRLLAFKHLEALIINKPGLVQGGHSWKHALDDAQPSHSPRLHTPGMEGTETARMLPHRSVPWMLRNAVELPLSFAGVP